MTGAKRQSISRAEWPLYAAVTVVFVLFRLPVLREPGVRLGWHSDAAVFGLMARDIYEGTFHVFWWGQSYMGSLASMFGALGGLIVGLFGVTPPVGPLGMRIGMAVAWLITMTCLWLFFRAALRPAVAMVVALLLTTGPDWLVHTQLAPRGGEMLLLVSSVILLLATRGMQLLRHWLIFGILTGLGWWTHQGVVFTAGGVLLIVLLRSRAWDIVRDRRRQAGWRRADLATRVLLRAVEAVLLVLLAAAVIREFVPQMPAFFLYSAVREALLAWLFFRLIVALLWGGALRDSLRHLWSIRREWAPRAAMFTGGAIVGYAPVIAGGVLGLYQNTYGLAVPLQSLGQIPAQIARVIRIDAWLLIGASWTPAGVCIGGVLLLLLLSAAARSRQVLASFLTGHPGDYGLRGVAGATLLLCGLFYVTSSRAYEGAVRYISPAVPILFAFAVAEAAQWWAGGKRFARAAAAGAVMVMSIAYAWQTTRLVDDIVSARAEGRFYTGPALKSGPTFDPRPTIRAIEQGGWRVCYAPFAVGVNLEWLLDRRVQFISRDSFEPRRDLARRLAALPLPKCRVTWEGQVFSLQFLFVVL